MEAFHFFVGLLGVSHIKDTQCGFKLFSRDAAKRVVPNVRLNGWIFDVEMLILAELLGLRVAEVSVNWSEKGGSKLRIAVDSMKMALDLLLMRFAYHSGLWKIYKGGTSKTIKR
jgi:dolichyl-phosphate beta-glucosyltransferase